MESKENAHLHEDLSTKCAFVDSREYDVHIESNKIKEKGRDDKVISKNDEDFCTIEVVGKPESVRKLDFKNLRSVSPDPVESRSLSSSRGSHRSISLGIRKDHSSDDFPKSELSQNTSESS